MDISTRSYLAAGVAAVGAAAIAVSPVQPLPTSMGLAPHRAEALAVGLAASIDPITPWLDIYRNSGENLSTLLSAFTASPLPVATQIALNGVDYLMELPDIGAIFNQVVTNVGNAFNATFMGPNAGPDVTTLDEAHGGLFELLPTLVEDLPQGLLDFTTTAVSGILLGLVGPVLAPVLALRDSVTAIIAAVQDSDILGAINELINIPANLVNAFLNGGQKIDLSGLLGPLLPSYVTLNSADFVVGGLLSPGSSLFNAVGADVKILTTDVVVPGTPAGLGGSLIALTNVIANAISPTPQPPATQPGSSSAAAEIAPAAAVDADSEAAPAVDTEAPVVVADEPAEDAPAPAPKRGRSAAGSDNSGNDTAKRVSGRGMAKSASARGAN
jgi:hypothetical protein